MNTQFHQDIKYLQGVGPSRADVLKKELGITTLGDLIYYYPYKHVDRSRIYQIRDINGSMPYVQLKGEILSMELLGTGRAQRAVAHFTDGTGYLDLVWFNRARQIGKYYDCHKPYVVYGKPTVYNGKMQITHPEMDLVDERCLQVGVERETSDKQMLLFGPAEQIVVKDDNLRNRYGKMVPGYNTTERMKKMGLDSAGMTRLMANAFQLLRQPVEETLPPYLIERNRLISLDEALHSIHFPQTSEQLSQAERRLKYEELFYVQLNIARYARRRQAKTHGLMFRVVGDLFNGFYHDYLPFPLTGAQKRVVREIRKDTCSGKQMNRLLQGDVGSGKTLVALLCALLAVDNGFQTCIMAPTEILAEQHVVTLRSMLGDLPVRVELLTGMVKGKKRRQLLEELRQGDIHILVGTHAVIEDAVTFANLGLVVIDEQHRFGVAQRARLWQKNDTPPHVLVMTATPIPRTLAMTLYGDLDVSVIDELPPGRKPIKTLHSFDARHDSLYAFLRQELLSGRQAYVVFPLIEESEKIDLKNLETGYEEICQAFPNVKIGKVHGKMKPLDKDAEMQRFVSGETKILVSTTVIEVGVNVPNASVMVIENAERFGLSQLHQLRGRVGRGADQSYCVLVTGYKLGEDTKKRIQIMVDSNDGFEIAEQDLELRGPGDLEGTQQSGMAFDLRIANLAKDGRILQTAREDAFELLDRDPEESNQAYQLVWKRLKELRKNQMDWSEIS